MAALAALAAAELIPPPPPDRTEAELPEGNTTGVGYESTRCIVIMDSCKGELDREWPGEGVGVGYSDDGSGNRE